MMTTPTASQNSSATPLNIVGTELLPSFCSKSANVEDMVAFLSDWRSARENCTPVGLTIYPIARFQRTIPFRLQSLTSAGYHDPVHKSQRDGCHQDQGLAEI